MSVCVRVCLCVRVWCGVEGNRKVNETCFNINSQANTYVYKRSNNNAVNIECRRGAGRPSNRGPLFPDRFKRTVSKTSPVSLKTIEPNIPRTPKFLSPKVKLRRPTADHSYLVPNFRM